VEHWSKGWWAGGGKQQSTRRLGEGGFFNTEGGFRLSAGRDLGSGQLSWRSGNVNRLGESGNQQVGNQDGRLRGCWSGTRVMSGDVTPWRSGETLGWRWSTRGRIAGPKRRSEERGPKKRYGRVVRRDPSGFAGSRTEVRERSESTRSDHKLDRVT
jgi:hypothetical protein